MITDLSYPPGASINGGINSQVCTLTYVTVDAVAREAPKLGKGCLLAKADIESAYCLVPVHPDDRPLLAIRWGSGILVDAMLQFGLRSAPKIFTALMDGLEWVLRQRGVEWIWHYLDNFIMIGPPNITT